MPRLKVREIRDRYDRGDIRVRGQYTPRSGTWVQSPNTPSQIRDAKLGSGTLYPMDIEQVIWDLPLSADVTWLTSGSGKTTFQAGNTVIEFDEVRGGSGHTPLESGLGF